MTTTNGTNAAIRQNASEAAAVSAETTRDSWTSAVEQTLARVADSPNRHASSARSRPVDPLVRPSEGVQGTANDPVNAPNTRSGLRARLLIVDVVATSGSWLFLATLSMPATTADRQWGAALAATIVTLATMQVFGLYRSRVCARRRQELARVIAAVLVGATIFDVLRGDASRSVPWTIAAAGLCILAVMTLRWGFGLWLRSQRALGRYLRGLVMIGTNEDAVAVWTMLDSEPELGYEVRGIIGKRSQRSDWADLPSSCAIDQLPEMARQTGACGVLLVANALSGAEVRDAIKVASANGLHVHLCPAFRGLGARRVRQVPISGEAFFYVEPGQRRRWQLAAKRAGDLFGAAIGLLIATPVLLLASIAIRLEDGGPAFYRQLRIGLNERPFLVYKLRTMTVHLDDAVDLSELNERTEGPLFKAAHDPRVTRVGAVLRALSIDELPQLFNVLNGTMSLVGPRPALPEEVAQFDPELMHRHSVKPGVTGLWQIEARDNPSFHAYRRLDLLYVDNLSIGLDVWILLATVPIVMARAMNIRRKDQRRQEATAEAR
jgi:exopolysaccharide biosynthesis polyprenyl glycosylphosphotransferase